MPGVNCNLSQLTTSDWMTGHRCRCKHGLCVQNSTARTTTSIRSVLRSVRHVLTLGLLWVSERSILAADGLIVPALLLHLLTHFAGVPILHLGVRVSTLLPLTVHMNPPDRETHNKQPSVTTINAPIKVNTFCLKPASYL